MFVTEQNEEQYEQQEGPWALSSSISILSEVRSLFVAKLFLFSYLTHVPSSFLFYFEVEWEQIHIISAGTPSICSSWWFCACFGTCHRMDLTLSKHLYVQCFHPPMCFQVLRVSFESFLCTVAMFCRLPSCLLGFTGKINDILFASSSFLMLPA